MPNKKIKIISALMAFVMSFQIVAGALNYDSNSAKASNQSGVSQRVKRRFVIEEKTPCNKQLKSSDENYIKPIPYETDWYMFRKNMIKDNQKLVVITGSLCSVVFFIIGVGIGIKVHRYASKNIKTR